MPKALTIEFICDEIEAAIVELQVSGTAFTSPKPVRIAARAAWVDMLNSYSKAALSNLQTATIKYKELVASLRGVVAGASGEKGAHAVRFIKAIVNESVPYIGGQEL